MKLKSPSGYREYYEEMCENWGMKEILIYSVTSVFETAMYKLLCRRKDQDQKFDVTKLGCVRLNGTIHAMNDTIRSEEKKVKDVDEFKAILADTICYFINCGYQVRCAYHEMCVGFDSETKEPIIGAEYAMAVSPFDPADYAEQMTTFAVASQLPKIESGSYINVLNQINRIKEMYDKTFEEK